MAVSPICKTFVRFLSCGLAWQEECGFHRCDHLAPKLLIAIKDQVFVRGLKWKRLSQLLDDPTARRMLRDVKVQDAPAIMTDDKEAVEHAECNRWHSEEIHGRNRFSMVSKEDQPALGPVRISRRSLHPTGDGSLRKLKTEHAEFPMDPRRSPSAVLDEHTEDQFPNLFRRPFPSSLASGLWKLGASTYKNQFGASGRQSRA